MFFEKYFYLFLFLCVTFHTSVSVFQSYHFPSLGKRVQGIGFNNTSQTYLSFFLIKMKLFCNLLIHKCISHEQF